MTIGESLDLRDQSNTFGISQKVWRAGRRLTLVSDRALIPRKSSYLLSFKNTQLLHELAGRLGLSPLPTVDSDE
ncbi:MAG: hypothetical protein DMF97_21275 [Acidobacteria bacterium]|nr:MAG: hypothetical protein DMF97_21275 [Acidobacteriota bacterium]